MLGFTFNIQRHRRPSLDGQYELSQHVISRMGRRGLSSKAIQAALTYGRVVHTRGARIFAVGRKEIAQYGQHGADLRDLDGVQVVCSPRGLVLTAYRNRDFRCLRPKEGLKSGTPHSLA